METYTGSVATEKSMQPEPGPPLLIEGGDVVLPDRLIRKGAVLVLEGKIHAVGPADRVGVDIPRGCRRIMANGQLISPCLWEVHIHGCGGVSTEGMTADTLVRMGAFLAARGVGAFLPTTVANEQMLSDIGAALEGVDRLPELRGRALGMYVEGPFVAPARKGGIPEELLRKPSIEYLRSLAGKARNRIKAMTFAPELPGASELFNAIASLGILPCLGHSDARFEDLAIYDNVTPLGITHLFNGMSGISHKEPGLAQWAMLNETAYTELNCDGTHVHDAAVQLALRARPWQRMVIISDAFTPAGLEEGAAKDLTVYGKPVVARGQGVYYADSGVLVGSRRLVNDGVARLVSRFNIPLPWAVAMASLNPARHLGYLEKGALLPGYDADVAILSRDFGSCSLMAWEGRPVLDALP
jgi:N-acetylglucosamine-6-phosphate deacetylase